MWPLLYFLACSSYFHFRILVPQSRSLMIWRWDISKLHRWYFCHPVDWSAAMTTCWVLLTKRVTLQLMFKHPLMGYISVKPRGGCSLEDACSVRWSFGKLRDILYPTSKICVIKWMQVMGILVLVSAWYNFFCGHSGMIPCAEHHTLVFTHETPSRQIWKSYPCSVGFQSAWGTFMGNCYVCTNWQSRKLLV